MKHGTRTVGRWISVMILALVALMIVSLTGAWAQSLFYAEREKDGRIYVFNTPERLKLWEASGEMGTGVTLPGRGAKGETLVGENEAAIDLYNFKHDLPGYDRSTTPPPAALPSYPQVKVGGLAYLSYQRGTASTVDYNKFVAKRGYIIVNAKINDYFSARITPDITQEATGDVKLRIKYAYGKFESKAWGAITSPIVELGVVHTPWLDFEEHIDPYRLQDTMFMERNGLFSSADFGVTFAGLFGGTAPDSYTSTVSKDYPGRYGSFAVGVYNGGGYNAVENNRNKSVEARVTVRPVPSALPGLQISYFGVSGKGNVAQEPDWNSNAIMGSYESVHLTFTAQWVKGNGNGSGSAASSTYKALDRDGWSIFGEGKFTKQWRAFLRYDRFDPNKDAADDVSKRTIFGVAYFLNSSNLILVDYDRVDYQKTGKPADDRFQTTLQVSF